MIRHFIFTEPRWTNLVLYTHLNERTYERIIDKLLKGSKRRKSIFYLALHTPSYQRPRDIIPREIRFK